MLLVYATSPGGTLLLKGSDTVDTNRASLKTLALTGAGLMIAGLSTVGIYVWF